MTDSDTDTTFNTAIELIAQLPLEIQQPILKTALLNYFLCFKVVKPFPCDENDEFVPLEDGILQRPHRIVWDKDMIFQLLSSIGYDSKFDDILSLVIQEIQLDDPKLDETCFEKLATFVLSRSIKLNMIVLRPGSLWSCNNSLGKKFLRFGCKRALLMVPEDLHGMNREFDIMSAYLPLTKDNVYRWTLKDH
ncbi:unnamed protein product [Ambrosiozyma monospora]|uniref:Unnamed protein product n=1 Tax=Ambrosiozyma monospora TaxID=43982 RepID=A0ACB5T3T6_AMBMO|nr:unnamed protein product [Ambrosiozyma monospora]